MEVDEHLEVPHLAEGKRGNTKRDASDATHTLKDVGGREEEGPRAGRRPASSSGVCVCVCS